MKKITFISLLFLSNFLFGQSVNNKIVNDTIQKKDSITLTDGTVISHEMFLELMNQAIEAAINELSNEELELILGEQIEVILPEED